MSNPSFYEKMSEFSVIYYKKMSELVKRKEMFF